MLGNEAKILLERGDLDEAMALIKEQEEICRGLFNKRFYHYAYDSVGNRLTETTQLTTKNYVYGNGRASQTNRFLYEFLTLFTHFLSHF